MKVHTEVVVRLLTAVAPGLVEDLTTGFPSCLIVT